MTATLVGRFRQSKRLVAELYEIVYGLSISPASVCAMERRVSEALAAPVDQARHAIRKESFVGSDETGWRRMRLKAWLWLTATDQLAVFTIARRRSSTVVKRILGEAFAGVVTSDRWSAYSHLDRRQLCWAHLLRDFVGMMERFHSPWHGNRLRVCALEVMAAYGDREAGFISHDEMVHRLQPIRERTRRRLRWASENAPGPTARTKACEILKLEPHLWTFLDDPAIPVTNNLCERLLRYAVIWRKLSYGTQSMAGTRFMERILTVCATLQLQHRDVFGYLTEAVDAHIRNQAAPSILPATLSQG
jgi:transposase